MDAEELKQQLAKITELKKLKRETLDMYEKEEGYVIYLILESLIETKLWMLLHDQEEMKVLEPGEYQAKIVEIRRVKVGRDMVTIEVTGGKSKGKRVEMSI